MGVPTSDVGYTSATTGRGDHEVHKGHVVALGRKKLTPYIVAVSDEFISLLGLIYFGYVG
jgi:hypothetical protein